MTSHSDQRATAYDPFGEPMAVSRGCEASKDGAEVGSFRETRRAAVVFWALALLLVGGRIYLSDQPVAHAPIAEAAGAAVQMTALR